MIESMSTPSQLLNIDIQRYTASADAHEETAYIMPGGLDLARFTYLEVQWTGTVFEAAVETHNWPAKIGTRYRFRHKDYAFRHLKVIPWEHQARKNREGAWGADEASRYEHQLWKLRNSHMCRAALPEISRSQPNRYFDEKSATVVAFTVLLLLLLRAALAMVLRVSI
jgi:hypothetical protein